MFLKILDMMYDLFSLAVCVVGQQDFDFMRLIFAKATLSDL